MNRHVEKPCCPCCEEQEIFHDLLLKALSVVRAESIYHAHVVLVAEIRDALQLPRGHEKGESDADGI